MIETSLPGIDGVSLPAMDAVQSIDGFLSYALDEGASDIHLSCGKKPKARIDGELRDIPGADDLQPAWLANQMKSIMSRSQQEDYTRDLELDFSYGLGDRARFRVNFFVQSGTPAAVFRAIPQKVKTILELGLPQSLATITNKPNGLVLVTGPTGSGKSTTLAAMIEERNLNYDEHILTIEDPIEFIYQSKRALINQREVGSDTKSFHESLRRVLRQDPDVILIGELRDAETISIALTAAETGHLVFGTLHTQSAAKSINRIIDSFPSHQHNQVRSQLSDTLQAIISQTLLRRKGGGRVAATEILVRNPAIANLIREGKTAGIRDQIQTGKNSGMHTLDQDLERLVKTGQIEKALAEEHIFDKNTLKNLG